MPKSKSFFLIEGGLCLSTCSFLGIFGLILAQNEVTPELFNPIMTGFIWTFIGSILGIIIGVGIQDRCERRRAKQRVATSESENPENLNELELDNAVDNKSGPQQILAVVIPGSQKCKYQSLSAESGEEELSSIPLTPKSRISG